MNRITGIRLVCVALIAVIMTVTMLLVPETVQPVEASPNYDSPYISCGETVTGLSVDGNYYDYWFFSGRIGNKVTITMTRTSGNLDSMVRLYFSKPGNNDFERLLEAGTAGGSNDAFISNFTLPKTGTYSINPRRVNGKEGNTTGSYRLTLDCNTRSSSGSGSSSSNSSGESSSNSCPERGGDIYWEGMIRDEYNINNISTNLGDFWAFRANSGDRVELRLSSYDFDPAIGLYYWDGTEWDILGFEGKQEIIQPPDAAYAVIPTAYIIKSLNKSGCYYVWVMASDKETGQYALEIGIN